VVFAPEPLPRGQAPVLVSGRGESIALLTLASRSHRRLRGTCGSRRQHVHDRRSFEVRLPVAAGDTALRFSYRTVNPGDPSTAFYRIGSEGASIRDVTLAGGSGGDDVRADQWPRRHARPRKAGEWVV